jgi:alkylated DNA repair dioxygenase AlkB
MGSFFKIGAHRRQGWTVERTFDLCGRLADVTVGFQGSLLDVTAETGPGQLGPSVRRTVLGRGAWIDLRPGWIAGADALFDRLRECVPWHDERRQMYDRVVDVPRLLSFYDEGDPLPDPLLDKAKRALDRHYAAELGEPFRTAGLCLYRDGRDSVAWHGDTIGRGSTHDTMVAIVSIGAPRALLLRPRGGGETLRHRLGHGDLIVMGGSCQRTWEHAIPKTARPTGPRISIQFRPRGVR